MKWFHRHRWVAFSMVHGTYIYGSGDVTVIAFVCKVCGKTKETTFKSHIEVDDFKNLKAIQEGASK